jgi:hypothetical protein
MLSCACTSAAYESAGPTSMGPGNWRELLPGPLLSVGKDGQRATMIASVRYLDEIVKQDSQ